jgi:chaperonin cofactor prefoldin
MAEAQRGRAEVQAMSDDTHASASAEGLSPARPKVITDLLAVDDTGTVANYIRRLEAVQREQAQTIQRLTDRIDVLEPPANNYNRTLARAEKAEAEVQQLTEDLAIHKKAGGNFWAPWQQAEAALTAERAQRERLEQDNKRLESGYAELNALFQAVMEVLEGREVSDFMQSFGAVRLAMDLRQGKLP